MKRNIRQKTQSATNRWLNKPFYLPTISARPSQWTATQFACNGPSHSDISLEKKMLIFLLSLNKCPTLPRSPFTPSYNCYNLVVIGAGVPGKPVLLYSSAVIRYYFNTVTLKVFPLQIELKVHFSYSWILPSKFKCFSTFQLLPQILVFP